MHRATPCGDGGIRRRPAVPPPSPTKSSVPPDPPNPPDPPDRAAPKAERKANSKRGFPFLATALAAGLALGGSLAAPAPARAAVGAPSGPAPETAEAPAGDPSSRPTPKSTRESTPTSGQDPVAALRAEVEALKDTYEAKITALEARIAELEARQAGPAPAETPGGAPGEAPVPSSEKAAGPAAATDELAALRAAARAAAAGSSTSGAPAAGSSTVEGGAAEPAAGRPGSSQPKEATFGRERNLNRLNPEISMTGNFLGSATDAGRDELKLQEFELNLESALDPFSSTKWTLSVGDEGVSVEEGYIDYSSLGHGLTLTAGKFRQSFGVLNRWHLHALPQIEYPLVIQDYLGTEGLAQTGLSASWVLPHGWADTNSLTVQVTDASADVFGGADFKHLSTLAHLSNYWDLSPSTYFELGLSGVDGETAEGGTARVWGTDLTLDWAPPGRSKYREVRWRTELMRSERDVPTPNDPTGARQNAWGGYSYLEGLLARNLWAGVRYDRVEDSLDPSRVREAIVPYVTWWQSEFVRLRGEYRMFDEGLGAGNQNAFTLQLTWAAGPHKHENY